MISANVIVRSVKMGSVKTVHAIIVLAPIATVKIGEFGTTNLRQNYQRMLIETRFIE